MNFNKLTMPLLKYMQNYKWKGLILYLSFISIIISCNNQLPKEDISSIYYPSNSLDYIGTPDSPEDRSSLAFSDQGAWFAYGFPSESAIYGGFSGPFLMTQENGVWSSKILSRLELIDQNTELKIDWNEFSVSQTSFNSHLEQVFENQKLKIEQTLFFASPHSTLITTEITNTSNETIQFQPKWKGIAFMDGLNFEKANDAVVLTFEKSNVRGTIQTFGDKVIRIEIADSTYLIDLEIIEIKPGETKQLVLSHQFIFPEYSIEDEKKFMTDVAKKPLEFLESRKFEKEDQLENIYMMLDTTWQDSVYKNLVAKTILTLQNNWRISAGELKHSGVFPSYHFIWFHGIWAWDSWKHAVAIAQYDPDLAIEQINVMYDFQTDKGFIPDCVFRDTTIEKHNYRNTKPPLSAWSAWKVYSQKPDIDFLKEIYPKIVKQHEWWYANRDHDKDGICEYGSTDGSLTAAKWESGMDNAVRFDHSKMLKNSETAFSLDQESVDLNAYLFAEKNYLIKMAKALNNAEDAELFKNQTEILRKKIQAQFFDVESGWFYDTSIDGKIFIKSMGCEGWIPLWAEVANQKQAEAVMINMVNPTYFNTKVPFQTLSANHPDFRPDGGYWRGPNWLDQAYFGVKGLHNYGYHEEAYAATYKLMHNAEGVLTKGKSIRENYQPITGSGLESENFSWSAAHYLLMLINE